MYKKLFTIMLVAIFLIVSFGAISAADDAISIPVKVVWDGDSGDAVTVNLIEDGSIVETATLNASNSWKTTFEVDDYDGEYNISVEKSDDFSSSVKGNAEKGFVVSCKLSVDDESSKDKGDVLGATENDNLSDNEDVLGATENDNLSDNGNVLSASGENNSSNNVVGVNGTNNGTANGTDNSTDNNTVPNNNEPNKKTSPNSEKKVIKTTKTTTTTVKKKLVKEEPKKEPKKENESVKSIKNNTGLPIIILVLAVFVAAFIPLVRKK